MIKRRRVSGDRFNVTDVLRNDRTTRAHSASTPVSGRVFFSFFMPLCFPGCQDLSSHIDKHNAGSFDYLAEIFYLQSLYDHSVARVLL